mmetsp:Transcript_54225/g.129221  ORF Transcript_54225/g.129221 Transcript_54225/m.129221 type:complete len:255 (-) Transcript_54225:954-1718(-)
MARSWSWICFVTSWVSFSASLFDFSMASSKRCSSEFRKSTWSLSRAKATFAKRISEACTSDAAFLASRCRLSCLMLFWQNWNCSVSSLAWSRSESMSDFIKPITLSNGPPEETPKDAASSAESLERSCKRPTICEARAPASSEEESSSSAAVWMKDKLPPPGRACISLAMNIPTSIVSRSFMAALKRLLCALRKSICPSWKAAVLAHFASTCSSISASRCTERWEFASVRLASATCCHLSAAAVCCDASSCSSF